MADLLRVSASHSRIRNDTLSVSVVGRKSVGINRCARSSGSVSACQSFAGPSYNRAIWWLAGVWVDEVEQ
jgi:hypothetical protein